MSISRPFMAGVLLAAAAAPSLAAETSENAMSRYLPVQAISATIGSKLVVGYFLQDAGTCRTTLFLSDAGDIYARPMKVAFNIARRADRIDRSRRGQSHAVGLLGRRRQPDGRDRGFAGQAGPPCG